MDLKLNEELDAILNNSGDIDVFTGSLDCYLNKVENGMNNWLNLFEWNREKLFEQKSSHGLTCPFNSSHTRISHTRYARHVQRCRLKSLGFSKLSIIDYYKQPVVDSAYQIHDEKAGHSPHSLFTLLNQTEKLRLYDQAITKSKENHFPVDSNWNEQTFLIAQSDREPSEKINESTSERDKKRRPKSYKTSKSKSYTDTIRQLIQSQMEAIQTTHNYQRSSEQSRTRADRPSKSTSHISNSRRSRSRSRSRSPRTHTHRRHRSDHKKKEKR